MQELIEEARQLSTAEFAKYNGKFGSAFMLTMTEICVQMASQVDEPINKDALIIGAYLHDIGRNVTDGPEHNTEGATIVRQFFADHPTVDETTKKIVIDCTLHHGSTATPETREGQIMQFIDKASLINRKIIHLYVDRLMKKMPESQACEEALQKVQGWWVALGDRKEELRQEFELCVDYLNRRKSDSVEQQ